MPAVVVIVSDWEGVRVAFFEIATPKDDKFLKILSAKIPTALFQKASFAGNLRPHTHTHTKKKKKKKKKKDPPWKLLQIRIFN